MSDWNVGESLFVGSASQAQADVMFGYDDDNIYIAVKRSDQVLEDEDGVVLTLSGKRNNYIININNTGVYSGGLNIISKTFTKKETSDNAVMTEIAIIRSELTDEELSVFVALNTAVVKETDPVKTEPEKVKESESDSSMVVEPVEIEEEPEHEPENIVVEPVEVEEPEHEPENVVVESVEVEEPEHEPENIVVEPVEVEEPEHEPENIVVEPVEVEEPEHEPSEDEPDITVRPEETQKLELVMSESDFEHENDVDVELAEEEDPIIIESEKTVSSEAKPMTESERIQPNNGELIGSPDTGRITGSDDGSEAFVSVLSVIITALLSVLSFRIWKKMRFDRF